MTQVHTAERAILLVNLGTPARAERSAVRRYLAEFLWDHRVLDMHPLARWCLLRLLILPFRTPKTTAAYAKIWGQDGSPLLSNARALTARLQERLPNTPALLAMRYGEPTMATALDELDALGVDRVTVLPLYPQYAAAATGSSLARLYALAGLRWDPPALHVVPSFYAEPGFIAAQALLARPIVDALQPDKVLFSYHGLPERQIRKSDPSGKTCLASADCCAQIDKNNRHCYRAQCYATSRALAAEMGLGEDDYVVGFQSRLGRIPWIKPYSDKLLEQLPKEQGVRSLVVLTPSFINDCLETLEEMGMRGKEQFTAAGGERYGLVPCVNDHPLFVEAIVRLTTAQDT